MLLRQTAILSICRWLSSAIHRNFDDLSQYACFRCIDAEIHMDTDRSKKNRRYRSGKSMANE